MQPIGTRIKLAHALAQQWFGVFITPHSEADGKSEALVQLYLVCTGTFVSLFADKQTDIERGVIRSSTLPSQPWIRDNALCSLCVPISMCSVGVCCVVVDSVSC
jgi:hypothetical protein